MPHLIPMQAGKLAVSFKVMPIPGPYWIIRLEGTAQDKYSRAVVVTCEPKKVRESAPV